MGHYNFKKDLEIALLVEKEVMELLPNLFKGIQDLRQSTSKEFDIQGLMNGKILTFEVKNDMMAAKTGNIAIEYEYRGKASALAITKANYWVYKFMGQFFIFRTSTLRQKIFEDKAYFRAVVGGDKGSYTKMFLVKVRDFKSWGKELL